MASDGSRKAIVQRDFPLPADHLNQVGWWDPQEMANPKKLFQTVFKQKKDYESKIREVYLQIAQGL